MKAADILMWNSVTDRAVNGYLYNWPAYSNLFFFPTDWILPTRDQYETLFTTAGALAAGGALKAMGLDFWLTPNTGATDIFGFSVKGSGRRDGGTGTYLFLKTKANLISSTRENIGGVYDGPLAASFGYLRDTTYMTQVDDSSFLQEGYSARAIYEGTGVPPATITDYDGNIYDIIQIGTQYWTVQNWKCAHLNDGTLIPNVMDNAAWAALITIGRCAYNNDESLV